MIEIPYGLVQHSFCQKKETGFAYFGSRNFVLCHGSDPPPIEVTLTVSDDGDYYGFWHGPDNLYFPNQIRCVFKNKDTVDACFPHGYSNEEALGRGRLVKLIVKEIS